MRWPARSEPLSGRSDRDIASEYRRTRSEAAFRELYARHSPTMYGLAIRLGGRSADAEDAVQEAWVRALPQLESFRWESTLRTWLCGFVVNCCRERLRGPLWPPVEDEWDLPAPAQTLSIEVEQLLQDLPPGYRALVVLHDLFGYTHGEIARMLGVDAGTCRSQLSRARRTLRRWLRSTVEARDACRRE